MSIKRILLDVENFLGIKCTHESVTSDSCNFCPDCGEKVIIRWVSIKCKKCGHLRTAKNKSSYSIIPEKDFCCFCGSDKWAYQHYYDSNIPDKLRELSVKQVILNKENPFINNINNNTNAYTNVWVEKPQQNQNKYKSNVIKAKRFK